MKIHKKQWRTRIPAPLEEVWDFFTKPENLNRLTAGAMKFEIQSDLEGREMYEGMIIEYKVRPFGNIPLSWATEITKIKPKKYFIDEQRSGPYRMWHHEHHFEPDGEGVMMTDLLYYALPFGFLGNVVDRVFVSNKVNRIFEYRKEQITEIFGLKSEVHGP